MTRKPKRLVDLGLLKAIRLRPCIVCGYRGHVEPSHIKTVGSGGPDAEFNCVAMCRVCHMLWHQIGPSKFFERYPTFEIDLQRLGWETEGKLWHPNLSL